MDIVVCVKRVPDLSEAELTIAADGRGIVEDDLTFGTNEWDDYAVEEAVRLKEEHGGSVRVDVESGGGARFNVRLPINDPNLAAEPVGSADRRKVMP